ncbi:T6SS effector BTH_I2691 family protein [Burkholderia sp. AW33-5]
MSETADRCAVCQLQGLAVYLPRYAVVPKAFAAPALGPFSGAGIKEVSLTESKYALRQLREGFVYFLYERGPRGKFHWEVYASAADGTLTKLLDPAVARSAEAPKACSRTGHNALRVQYVVIEKPKECGKVWVAFSERPWSDATIKRYGADSPEAAEVRLNRMQAIDPAAWVAAPKPGPHVAPLTAANLQHVIEYAGDVAETPLEVSSLPYDFRPEISRGATGACRDNVLNLCTTRYPWAVRQGIWNKVASAQLVEVAQASSVSDGAPCQPMMLALWDAVGIAHELNGFRNDAVSWLDRYVVERALQITALRDIDTAKEALEKGAVDSESRFQSETGQATTAGLKDSAAALRKRAATLPEGPERTRSLQTADDYDYLAKNGLGGPYVAQVQSFRSDAERLAWRQKTDATIADINRTKQKRLKDAHDDAWPRYEAKLKRADIEAFRKKYAEIQDKVQALQEARTDDIGHWLKAGLWLATLGDCHDSDFFDGIAYEVAVGTAIFGLNSSPKGRHLVDSLVALLDATKIESIVWRAIAMNQKDGRVQLTQALQSAQSAKETPLQGNVDKIASVAASIKTVVGYYKKLASLAVEKDQKNITPVGKLIRALEIDQIAMTAGDSIFRKFRVNQGADFVGEKIIQTIFLQRAGISDVDTLNLVRKQAELEGLSRKEVLNTMRVAHGFIQGEEALGGMGKASRSRALSEAWNQLKLTEEGNAQLRSARVTVVTSLLEAVNFYKLMVMPHDENTTLNLISSGASLCSGLVDISMAPFYATLQKSTRSQAWKLVGGGLGSAGAFIGAWMDGKSAAESLTKKQNTVFFLTTIKVVAGAATGTAVFISAVGKSGPLLKRVASRYGTQVIVGVVEGLAERAAAFAAFRAVGMLLGWEATVVLLVVQGLIWYFTPNVLEAWCTRCAFGTGLEKDFFIEREVPRYTDRDVKKQAEEFGKALAGVQ